VASVVEVISNSCRSIKQIMVASGMKGMTITVLVGFAVIAAIVIPVAVTQGNRASSIDSDVGTPTPAPTMIGMLHDPSTESNSPSMVPSDMPSAMPSAAPSIIYQGTGLSDYPSLVPSSWGTPEPTTVEQKIGNLGTSKPTLVEHESRQKSKGGGRSKGSKGKMRNLRLKNRSRLNSRKK